MHEGSDEDENGGLERIEANDESFSLFVKKFGRFFWKVGNQRKTPFPPKKNFNKGEDASSIPKCYECNQSGHMKIECPIYLKKMEKFGKKSLNEKKARRHT